MRMCIRSVSKFFETIILLVSSYLLISCTPQGLPVDKLSNPSETPVEDISPVDIPTSIQSKSNSTNQSFEFAMIADSKSLVPDHFECSLDSQAYQKCSSPKAFTGLTEGPHEFVVRAVFPDKTVSIPNKKTWTVDLTKPVVSIGNSLGAETNQASSPIAFTATDASGISKHECSFDSEAFQTCSSPVVRNLSEGAHSLRVRAVDAAGNISNIQEKVWVIDLTAPVLAITSAPAAMSASNSAAFTFAATDAGGSSGLSYECSLDNAVYANCTSPLNLSSLSGGTHSFSVKAKDGAGNVSAISTHAWAISTTAPTLAISSKPNSFINTTTASVVFSATAGTGTTISSYQCSLDGATFATCTSPRNLTSLSAGAHSLQIKALDSAGNASAIQTASWTVDLSAPTVSFSSTPASLSNLTSANFIFTGADTGGSGVSGYQCSLDGAAFAACTSPQNFSSLASAAHSFSVKAIDGAGNTSAASTHSWTVSTALPTLAISSKPNTFVNTTSASVVFSATPASGTTISSYQCSLDSAAFSTCTSPRSLTGLSATAHTLQVKAIDSAGNTSAIQSASWTVDTAAPTVSFSSSPSALTSSTSANFVFAGVDTGGSGVASYQCSLDSAAFATCTSPQSLSGLSAASHTFAVRALDVAGNQGTAVTHSWTINTDSLIPVFSITPAAISKNTTDSFSFAAAGSVASYECSLDNAAFSTCTSPQNLSSLTAGSRNFRVRSVDSGGVRSSITSYSWVIDVTAPTLSISSSPSSMTNLSSANLIFSGTDVGSAIAGYECALDGGAFAACSSPKAYSSLSSGSHTFQVRAIDSAGNVSSISPASWTVDTVLPTVTISSNPNAATNATTANFVFAGSDTGGSGIASYQCSLDNAAFATCTSPKAYSGLTAGSHNFQVKAIDAATNVSVAQSYTWIVDVTVPTLAISNSPSAMTNSTDASFTLLGTDTGSGIASYQCSMDGAAFAACTSPKSFTGLASGAHSFQAKAFDTAGNTSTTQTVSWTIDSVAPVLTLSSKPAATTTSGSASFTFSATDTGGSGVASYQCSIDSAAFAACTSPKAYSGLTSGSHNFQVKAIDVATNVSAVQSYTWMIDNVAPVLTLSGKPNTLVNSSTASFTFSATDVDGSGVTGYQCSIDSGAFAACTSPKSYSSLSATSHTFQVKATDAAGNTSAAQSHTWSIDVTVPTLSLTSTPASSTTSTSASFVFSGSDANGIANFQCAIDANSFAACTSPQSYSGLLAGAHSFKVKAVDNAGNESAESSFNWSITGSGPAGNYDYLATTVSELNSILANTDATLSGKTIAFGPGAWPKLVLTNRRFTSWTKFTSQDNNNRPRFSAIQITNVNNVDIDGVNVIHTAWPARPQTGFGNELIYFGGTGTNLRIQNCNIKHGYGNTTWSKWPAGTTGLLDIDPVEEYPEFGYSYNNIFGPNESTYYGVIKNPVFKGGEITDAGKQIDMLNDLQWATTPSEGVGGIRIINEGLETVYYSFDDGTTGSLGPKKALTAETRPNGHLYFHYLSMGKTVPKKRLTLSTDPGKTTRVIVRTDVGIAGYLPYGIGGSDSYKNLEILNNNLSNLANAIKFSYNGDSTGKVSIIGNTMDVVYMDMIAFGIGKFAPKETIVAWNTATRSFNRSGIFEGGDPSDPHGDFIQFFGQDSGSLATSTQEDWRGIKMFGNIFFKGIARGFVQGIFLSDMNYQYGLNYRNMYIAGNLILSTSMPNSLTAEGYDNYVFRNTSLRSEPTEADNFAGGSGAAGLLSKGFNDPGNSTSYVGYNISESPNFDSHVLAENNIFISKTGNYAAGGYDQHLKGPFVNTHSTMADIFDAFMPKAGSVAETQKIGALGGTYVNYLTRTIDKAQEIPAWKFHDSADAPVNSTLNSNISAFMGGEDNQTLNLPSGVFARSCVDYTCSSTIQDWTSNNLDISPAQYFQLKAVAPSAPAQTNAVRVVAGVTERPWNIISAAPPFSKVEFNGDFLRTINNSGLISTASLTPTKFLIVFRASLGAFSANDVVITSANRIAVTMSTAGAIKLSFGGTGTRTATFPAVMPTDGSAATVLISVDLAAATASEGFKVYRNTTPINMDSNATWVAPSALYQNFGSGSAKIWSVMANNTVTTASSPMATALEADVEFIYFAMGDSAIDTNTGALLDIGSNEVQNKFKTTYIGANGSGPTGKVPELFMTGTASAWNSPSGINLGSGAKFYMNSTDTGVVDK